MYVFLEYPWKWVWDWLCAWNLGSGEVDGGHQSSFGERSVRANHAILINWVLNSGSDCIWMEDMSRNSDRRSASSVTEGSYVRKQRSRGKMVKSICVFIQGRAVSEAFLQRSLGKHVMVSTEIIASTQVPWI
jgi:hypothetical protein